MRSAKLGVALLIALSSRAAPQLSITHVNVVDVESGAVRPDRTVVIEGDRIRVIYLVRSARSCLAAEKIDDVTPFTSDVTLSTTE